MSSEIYSALAELGDVVKLRFKINAKKLQQELEAYGTVWQPYNPRKLGFGRCGLSLTSLDGSLSGIPDLDSLPEYNKLHGTEYCESDFKTPTRVLLNSKELQVFYDLLGPYLGRTHLLRFERGGFFPTHRDCFGVSPSTYRLFSIVTETSGDDYLFPLDGQLEKFTPGCLYLLNTKKAHSFVSFQNDLTVLVSNLILSPDFYGAIYQQLAIR